MHPLDSLSLQLEFFCLTLTQALHIHNWKYSDFARTRSTQLPEQKYRLNSHILWAAEQSKLMNCQQQNLIEQSECILHACSVVYLVFHHYPSFLKNLGTTATTYFTTCWFQYILPQLSLFIPIPEPALQP